MTTITSTELRIASQLGLNTGVGVSSTSSNDGVLETRNQIASGFAAENHIDSANLNWVGLQDSLSQGMSQIAFVQLTDEVLGQLESKLIELKVELEGAADSQKLTTIESEISRLVGENQILQTESVNIMSSGADISQKASLTSIKDYASYLNIDGLDVPEEMLFIEVNMQDVVNAHHDPATCPYCQMDSGFSDGDIEAPLFAPTSTTTELSSLDNSVPTDDAIATLVGATKWDTSSGAVPVTWSLYNNTAPYDDWAYAQVGYEETASPMTAFETDIQSAFALWDKASDLEFLQVTETANEVGEIRVAYTDFVKPGSAAWAWLPNEYAYGGDAWFDKGQATNQSFTVGSYGFYTALHEFGHSIGLSHPFDSSSLSGDTLTNTEDNRRMTIMSYNQSKYDRNYLPTSITFTLNGSGGYSWSTSSTTVNAVTPMVYDVAAVEYLYGVSTDVETGNTNHTANLSGFSTIVDSDGIDAIDASAETTTSIINLTSGSFSSIGLTTREALADALVASALSQAVAQGGTISSNDQASIKTTLLNYFSALDSSSIYGDAIYTGQDNLAIAYSATIENAIGGSGSDIIQGAHGVDNAIKGGLGNDDIDGMGGTDTAVYDGNYADFTITHNADGTITVVDNNAGDDDEGTDTLTSIEAIEFADLTYDTTAQTTTSTVTSALVSGTPADGITAGAPTTSTTPSGTTALPHGYTSLALSDIATLSGASAALEVVDRALSTVGAERARFGAVGNRLEYAASNLLSRIEHTTAAKSRIMDADYAVETTKLLREQIRQQVATVILGQANMSTQQVTQLLK